MTIKDTEITDEKEESLSDVSEGGDDKKNNNNDEGNENRADGFVVMSAVESDDVEVEAVTATTRDKKSNNEASSMDGSDVTPTGLTSSSFDGEDGIGENTKAQSTDRQHATVNGQHGVAHGVDSGVGGDEMSREDGPSDADGGTTHANGHGSPGTVRTGRDLGVWEKSLEDQASGNFLSQWTLWFLTPLLRLGSHKVLDAEDMGVPSEQDLASVAYDRAMEQWEKQCAKAEATNKKLKEKYEADLRNCATQEQREKIKEPTYHDPSIFASLLNGFGACRLISGVLFYLVSALLGFVPVLILNDLVSFFESGQSMDEYDGYAHPWAEVVALAFVPFLMSLLQTKYNVIMVHCAVFVRTAVSTMLYRKALRVSAAGRSTTSTGQVVNMMSNDTAQLQRFLLFAGMILVAPLQIVIALVLIYQQVQHATWVGVAFMIALAPVNTVVFSLVTKQRREVLKYSDLRVKMMNEILNGIRIIKFYAWERPFGKEVGVLREKELKALTRLAYTTAIGFSLILMSAPLIQPILVFLTYVSIQDEPLSAATAFTTVALFNIMRFPFAFLPMGLLQYIQSRISLKRLERYLDLPELPDYVVPTKPDFEDDEGGVDLAKYGSVSIKSGTFTWQDPDAKPIRPIQEVKVKKEKKKKKKRGGGDDKSGSLEGSGDDDSVASGSMRSVATSVATENTAKAGSITLQDITCSIEAGSLVAVVGAVGSGKSSFLSAILGEMEPLHGSKVYVPRPDSKSSAGYVSFCSQTPWVVNDTLRGNVLFGRELNQQRYDEVIESCALADDIAVLPDGDQTEIGERGINLSGGQKARVSLARAFYSRDTQIILMDDPLSAVDAHVGEHIFSRAIRGDIARGTTRLLVTHHVHLLSRCDKVIVLKAGRIEHQGTYRELIDQGVDFAGAVDVSKLSQSNDEGGDKAGEGGAIGEGGEKKKEDQAEKKKTSKPGEATKQTTGKSGKKLMSEEEKNEGDIDGSAYVHYARAGGYIVAALVLIVQGLGRGFEVMANFWLAHWAEKTLEASDKGDPLTKTETNGYLGIYALFSFGGILGLTFRAIFIAIHRLRASRKLHDDITESVLRAPVAFFDVTPTGRILNRFAADMDKIDLELTQSLSQGVSTVFSILGGVAAMVAATKGTFLGPLIPVGYLYFLIQKWFRKTSTELQRVNSIANSPIFTDFSMTLSGTSSIRAFGEEMRFFEKCKSSFDIMNASFVLVQLTNSWLALRLDVLGGLLAAFIGGVAVATSSADFIPAGWLGLALSYSIEFTNSLKHGVRMIATIEAQMNSVERVLYYTENITPEAPEFIPENDPDKNWPSNGEIVVQNASMRYRDGPLVLKDVSVRIEAGQKVGVCGRTGSGKSSMMIALFRISEIEEDGGSILIDGVDTSRIGLSPLRSNLSIIPQDPVIFSNSVRYNLDPFKTSTNAEIWETLRKVQMDEVVAALPGGLEEEVSEGGESFSQGQRQLLCIARSLLRKPTILVMDEATASIDNATDASIQRMIRENFQNATVLTIAHRLNTIMDSDRVLVLDNGNVAEYDSPQNLLKKEDGLFTAMVERSREANSNSIED